VLSGGRVSRGPDGLTFSVDYRLEAKDPDLAMHYVWVVRSPQRTVYEGILPPMELEAAGTLRGRTIAPDEPNEGQLETYLASERLIPGRLGWQQRRQISNAVPLAP
jgi:hypothetical protein